MQCIIEKANKSEKKEILQIYRSSIGEEGCTWDEEYPNMETIEDDINSEGLYCLKIDNSIIGTATLIKEKNIYDEFKDLNAYLLTRVGIGKKYQGKGYAKILLKNILENAIKQKIDLIYLLVDKNNIKAKKLYNFFDFELCKLVNEHGREWELLKKQIFYKGE